MAILSTGFHLRELAAAAVALFALSVIYKRTRLYLQRREFKKQHGCQPITRKRPMRDPLGILNMMRGARAMKEHKLLDLLLELYETVGTTFAFRFVDKYIIATHDPENIKTVLSLKFNDYGIGKREETFGELLGKGIFTTDGELWAHSRAMIRPNFTRDQVADLAAFERHVQALFKVIPEGATIDLQDLFFLFTIDSATEFLLGRSTNTLEARLTKEGAKEEQFAIAFNKAQHYIANRDRLSFLRYIIRDRESEAAVRQCHEFVDQYVEEAVAYRQKLEKSGLDTQSEDKYTFLYELAKATTDKKRLRDEILNVLLAGRDTTASLLSNMWFMIARHPEIYKKLKREVDETLNGDEPSYTQLRNMKYLKYCMNESLRLHPVVPANGRFAQRDTVLPHGGGPDGLSPIFVPKNTIISYAPYVLHRRTDYFGADAHVFRPERWADLRPGWEYLPFNGGPRICLGQQYALTEAGYVTVRLMQEFGRIEVRDPGEWREGLTLTLCSLDGVKVGLFRE